MCSLQFLHGLQEYIQVNEVTNGCSRHKLIKKPGAYYVSSQTADWLYG